MGKRKKRVGKRKKKGNWKFIGKVWIVNLISVGIKLELERRSDNKINVNKIWARKRRMGSFKKKRNTIDLWQTRNPRKNLKIKIRRSG